MVNFGCVTLDLDVQAKEDMLTMGSEFQSQSIFLGSEFSVKDENLMDLGSGDYG